jgi:hypothetical protein
MRKNKFSDTYVLPKDAGIRNRCMYLPVELVLDSRLRGTDHGHQAVIAGITAIIRRASSPLAAGATHSKVFVMPAQAGTPKSMGIEWGYNGG